MQGLASRREPHGLAHMKQALLVIKVGGNELDDPQFVSDLVAFTQKRQALSQPVAVVHGGGRFIEDLQSRLELPIQKVAGLRVTTPESMQAVRMALTGVIGHDLCLAFQRRGVAAATLSASCGFGAPCLEGRRKPVAEGFPDLGLVGDITRVDSRIFRLLLDHGVVPIIAPPAIEEGASSEWLNINADEAAAALAIALEATELVFVTNVQGVLFSGCLQTRIEAHAMTATLARADITGGMIPKLRAAAAATEGGVPHVSIGSLASIEAGTCTHITADRLS